MHTEPFFLPLTYPDTSGLSQSRVFSKPKCGILRVPFVPLTPCLMPQKRLQSCYCFAFSGIACLQSVVNLTAVIC